MSRASPILLLGAGGHARACIDVLERAGWPILGLIGSPDELGRRILGYSVLGSDEALADCRAQAENAIVAIGQIDTAAPRMAAFERLAKFGFGRPAIVSPLAYVSPHAEVGAGTIVMHGAVVNAGARIGCNCIVNSQALVEHDAEVGDHCHLSTGSLVNGGVRVGGRCFIGSGAVLRQGIVLGDDCFVGMGCTVTADLPGASRLTRRP